MKLLPETTETALATVTPTTTDIVERVVPRGKRLAFTLVDGYVRGEHRCRYELHATGCRDLNKVMKTHPSIGLLGTEMPNHEDCLDAVLADAIEQGAGTIKRADIWVQPCCNIVRMRAAGRA